MTSCSFHSATVFRVVYLYQFAALPPHLTKSHTSIPALVINFTHSAICNPTWNRDPGYGQLRSWKWSSNQHVYIHVCRLLIWLGIEIGDMDTWEAGNGGQTSMYAMININVNKSNENLYAYHKFNVKFNNIIVILCCYPMPVIHECQAGEFKLDRLDRAY